MKAISLIHMALLPDLKTFSSHSNRHFAPPRRSPPLHPDFCKHENLCHVDVFTFQLDLFFFNLENVYEILAPALFFIALRYTLAVGLRFPSLARLLNEYSY